MVEKITLWIHYQNLDINKSNCNILHIKMLEYHELNCSSKNKHTFSCVLDNVISCKFVEYFFTCNLIM